VPLPHADSQPARPGAPGDVRAAAIARAHEHAHAPRLCTRRSARRAQSYASVRRGAPSYSEVLTRTQRYCEVLNGTRQCSTNGSRRHRRALHVDSAGARSGAREYSRAGKTAGRGLSTALVRRRGVSTTMLVRRGDTRKTEVQSGAWQYCGRTSREYLLHTTLLSDASVPQTWSGCEYWAGCVYGAGYE
jgi:hypothetical protein